MNRRDFIKNASLIGGAMSLGFGLDHIIEKRKNSEILKDNIGANPHFKEFHGVYEFSVPLPLDYKLIDEIVELNNSLKKSKVVTLYNSLPMNVDWDLAFVGASCRGENPAIKSFDDFAKYVEYARKKGFKFLYTLNSPKPFTKEEFSKYEDHLYNLVGKLKSINCYDVRVANPQLFAFFQAEFPEFNLSGSTSLEYNSIKQYQNFLKIYPKTKSFVVSIDQNRNLPLLLNLKKEFPKVDHELLVNEFCLGGCPVMFTHFSVGNFYCLDCQKYKFKNIWEWVCKSNIIYPWWLSFYAGLGFKKFKLMSIVADRANIQNIDYVKNYLKAVESGGDDFYISTLLCKTIGSNIDFKKYKNMPVKEIKPYLPDIKYFLENGSGCAYKCGTDCRYCYDCAEKLRKIIPI